MPDERTYNVISGDKCLFESMTKEQILTAITEAVETHQITDVDTGFVQTIKEQNHGTGLKFWIGSTAEYNALQSIEQDVFYILTDDTELEDMEADIASFRETLAGINDIISNLSDTVATHTSEIEGLTDSVTDMQTRNGFVFLEDENGIPYNTNFMIPIELDYIHGDTPTYIDDFTIVMVTVSSGQKILCTVKRGDQYITILGVSHSGTLLYDNQAAGCGFVRDINILLYADLETRALTSNRSTSSQILKTYQNSAYNTDITFTGVQITKIVGVM